MALVRVRRYMACMATRSSTRRRCTDPEQLVLWKKRGGKRHGAGRPPKGTRAASPHKERPVLHARYPVHVTLRVVRAVGNLRRRCVYQAIREATLTTARREDFRIIQLSIQRTHVHLLVEANDRGALSRGMQGFQISAARHLNAAISEGKPGPRRRVSCSPIAITPRSSLRRDRRGTPCPISPTTGESTRKTFGHRCRNGPSTGSPAQ